MNLVSAVISKKSFLITKDNKIKRVLSQFEKEYHSNNAYSKYIIKINDMTSDKNSTFLQHSQLLLKCCFK